MLIQLCFLILFCAAHRTDTSCQFPSNLRGNKWFTTSNGEIEVATDGSTMTNYASAVKSGTLTITCDEYESSTDRYISSVVFTVFGSTTLKAFFCMKFTKLSAVKYLMTYDTDIDTVTTFIRVVVISNSTGTLTPSQACALTSTQPTGTQEVLIRTDSVSSSTVSCPGSLNFNLAAIIQSSGCSGSSILGASSVTQHTYSYSSCVTSKYSSRGIFDCVYSVTEGAYTYVNVFNNDTSVDETTTYRYLCYVTWSSGNIVYYTYHPKICQPTQTPTVTGSDDGVAVVAYYSFSDDVASQIAVGVMFGLILLALIIVTVIFLALFLDCRQKLIKACSKKKLKESSKKTKGDSTNRKKTDKKKEKRDKKKKKKKEKVDENQNIDASTKVRRKDSLWEKEKEGEGHMKWADFVGINSSAREYKKPEWQQKWEDYKDPLRGKTIVFDGGSETARSTDSVASTSKVVWILPEKEEEERTKSLWDKVYRLWFEPRKTIPENKFLEMQKLAKLAKPKHVRFKGTVNKSKDDTAIESK